MKFNDYDLFEVGEMWYLLKDEKLIIAEDEVKTFKENSDVLIVEINREGNTGYGFAMVNIEGYSFKFGLDELFDMVFE
jgi:hypothetical protein